MIYCCHCGQPINEEKIEAKASSREKFRDVANNDTEVQYICPRCGHIAKRGCDEEDIKSLSRACHAELQRGRNSFAKGMCSLSIAIILLVTSIIFLTLSRKADNQFKITVSTPEFWVFAVLAVISVILLVYGGIETTLGLKKKSLYTKLLKDINNKTFVQ